MHLRWYFHTNQIGLIYITDFSTLFYLSSFTFSKYFGNEMFQIQFWKSLYYVTTSTKASFYLYKIFWGSTWVLISMLEKLWDALTRFLVDATKTRRSDTADKVEITRWGDTESLRWKISPCLVCLLVLVSSSPYAHVSLSLKTASPW